MARCSSQRRWRGVSKRLRNCRRVTPRRPPDLSWPDMDDTSLLAISRRLRLTRKALGMRSWEFCRLTGLSQQSLTNYERGYGRLSLDSAFKICRATGVSLDWLFRGVDTQLPREIGQRICELEAESAGA